MPSVDDSELDTREGLLGQASAKGLRFLGSVRRNGMILLLSGVVSPFVESDGTVELWQGGQGDRVGGSLREGGGPKGDHTGDVPGWRDCWEMSGAGAGHS